MSSRADFFLLLWSAASFGWLAIAWILVSRRKQVPAPSAPADRLALSIFKPLPPLEGPAAPAELVGALESFVSQLDDSAEMLIGVLPADEPAWRPHLDRWKSLRHSRIKVIVARPALTVANPKIAWQIRLAPEAAGELWLWSDADIVAPPGFLDSIRGELASAGTKFRALTCPYIVRRAKASSTLLDALFVNVEFFPGTLLLRQLHATRGVDFALGAAILFYAEDFRSKASWENLGETLADDNELGRSLAPVLISQTIVETVPLEPNIRGSISHYLRWHKTIRWCEPFGYAAQALILPLLGWLAAVIVSPHHLFPWYGLGATALIESILAALICWHAGCRIPARLIAGVLLWPQARIAAWVLSWLPGPVVWTGRRARWWSLTRRENRYCSREV